MEWLREIEIEVLRAKQTQNPGRIRTIGRRIAGIAIQELQQRAPKFSFGEDYLRSLQGFSESSDLPSDAVNAAARLHARLAPDFSSPSIDPLGDAMIIVEFVKKEIHIAAEKNGNT